VIRSSTPRLIQLRSALAFWSGCALVTAGVVLHLPMFLMSRDAGYVLAGMPMDAGMLLGMALIVAGIAATGYGLLPPLPYSGRPQTSETIPPPEDAPLTRSHWQIASLLGLALIIDIMKPASLGFVTPGMRAEYAVSAAMVAWLPLGALAGTVIGSYLWGVLADLYGRRASILLSSVMFIGTSICGAMPDFWWNVFMCVLMGMAAGGMLPVTYALLAEIMPTRHRGWFLVLIGGIGAIGGFLAASGFAALLQPEFGWRVMWFLNLPTGLILIALSPLLPESARFLQRMGRAAEARAMLARFGATLLEQPADRVRVEHRTRLPAADRNYVGLTCALTSAALAWGLVNFGILLWLPSALVDEGHSVGVASALIARSTLIAAPTIVIATWLYHSWSTKGALLVMTGTMTLGLIGLLLRASGLVVLTNPVLVVAPLIVGAAGVISILLPFTAESYPLRIRGQATGWVAGCSKFGGLIAQSLSVIGVAPPLAAAALVVVAPTALSLLLISRFGHETAGSDLRELERASPSTT
jgi:MFS transporter, putative metabolite:H+ symporter